MFQPGSRILAQYSNAAGEPLHERVILSKSFGSFYTLCSPDEDVYTERIGGTEDIITYWLVAADGSRPPLPPGRLVYGFGDFTCFDGAAGAAKIREGIADAVVHRGTHRPDLGPDPSEALAEAAAIRAEGGVSQPVGLFGVVAAAPAGGGAPPRPRLERHPRWPEVVCQQASSWVRLLLLPMRNGSLPASMTLHWCRGTVIPTRLEQAPSSMGLWGWTLCREAASSTSSV